MQKTQTQQQRGLRDRGICVIIPTYNNAGTVRRVVDATLHECSDVIVVCDGCTDGTDDIVAAIPGVDVVSYPCNKGKGGALREGFRYALSKGFAYAITLDADAQHYPTDIAKMLDANIKHPGALIIGHRQLCNVERSSGSSFANKFANFWFWVQTGKHGCDTQSGYRLYPLRKLKYLSLLTDRYEAELELLVLASWHGVEINDVPIDVHYPSREERVSHFRPGRDFARISLLNTVLCVMAVFYGLPLRLYRGTMNVARTLYTIVFFSFFTLAVFQPFFILYFKIGKVTNQKRDRLRRFIQWASRFVIIRHGIPGTTFSYSAGEETFDKPAVIICNHQSHFDLMCQLIFTPKTIFLTKDWVWNNPFYGKLIKNAEYVPVMAGIDEYMPQLKNLVSRGFCIAVYPEGHRSKTCEIQRFHQGAFHLAKELDVDVLPMCLYGPGKVLPPRTYLMRKHPMYIEVGKRISQSELMSMGDTLQQASSVRKLYKSWYHQIANKIEQDV